MTRLSDKSAQKITPVILSGGSGSRLWPLSRKAYSKQFLNLNDGEKSLIQQTALRVSPPNLYKPAVIVCGDDHKFLVKDQMAQLGLLNEALIFEPQARNTAPAVALACFYAVHQGAGDEPMLILPSDHAIRDKDAFHATIEKGISLAMDGDLVTFGVVPTYAETGYGYIEKSAEAKGDGFAVKRFVEKPDAEKAKEFLQSGDFFWNAGIFMFKPNVYLQELRRYQSEMYEACRQSFLKAEWEEADMSAPHVRPDAALFANVEDLSIDYAVMEHARNVSVVPYKGHWNDIGSFAALWEEVEHDENGNAVQGGTDTLLQETKNCFIHSEGALITTSGLEGLVIVQTADAVLIASKENAQDVKNIYNQLKDSDRSEVVYHRQVFKPWGNFNSLARGHRFQVKTLTVKPGQLLSLQSHEHRAEHWIVVKGQVRVTHGSDTFTLYRDESTFIPVGEVHRLSNPFEEEAILVEVQTGDYLEEDDIVRYSDVYGRGDSNSQLPLNMHEAHRRKKHLVPLDVRYKIRKWVLLKPLLPVVRRLKYMIHFAQWMLKGKGGATPYFVKWMILRKIAKQYALKTFVETGAHYGETLAAMKRHFDHLIGIELSDALYQKVKHRFSGFAKIQLLKGDSLHVLPSVLKMQKEPVLFYLDSHYTGGLTARGEKETAVSGELSSILSHPLSHVIVIPDARCFTGENDYPRLEALKETVLASKRYQFELKGDMILITPK